MTPRKKKAIKEACIEENWISGEREREGVQYVHDLPPGLCSDP